MIASDIIDRARAIRLEDEIARRNIKLKGKVDRSGPCPVCGGCDRFAIHIRKQKWNCRNCKVGGGDAIGLVQFIDGIGFVEAVELLTGEDVRPQARPIPPAPAKKQSAAEYERDQHRKAAWLWPQRQPIIGSNAELPYLRESRGITCPLPATLGFLPGRDDYPPAMIAAYALVDEPEPGVLGEPRDVQAVHLTRLLPDGSDRERGKDAKITIGSPQQIIKINGKDEEVSTPIVLAPPNDLLALAITEGIEDALSIHQALGIGAWAAGSAPLLPKLALRVPGYIEVVHVELHPDDGRRYAEELISRLRARGIKVFPREAIA
jgi:hypothetical protein